MFRLRERWKAKVVSFLMSLAILFFVFAIGAMVGKKIFWFQAKPWLVSHPQTSSDNFQSMASTSSTQKSNPGQVQPYQPKPKPQVMVQPKAVSSQPITRSTLPAESFTLPASQPKNLMPDKP
ncbi:MAG: hypothetical protein COX39_02530 [Candidatus Nealsonbacteria bacterium CG23_combo_of_CG06-09_8_20_14_all_40_13]|uniref:Uncharacterized protein n=1 Tax=Candidatus Nealsonbacteria bacterium CG23_combo_of_CG06-09_8_20_14_all_40_13 TaxID=1974724 RepID=A0A2G9YQJ0_9BACT|nr:MAG: hypothetical protein COX39_02530 [Candidatus Nealsonbacteria bacterium CG23_combo_of_CG06-09_8_20_14_all_40_13]PIR70894.1 MAG: hypothetical protein COU44_02620 [Candidatus Nealsonbacteria bacterium CG10_big_fil_rev_8_21_14_0_10_40_24]PIU43524.1 MAG: hypothetical protein COS97_00640 [Candidatus Nealsonbacteria bacterium CG07_land_8_20_14_0_80_40_10]